MTAATRRRPGSPTRTERTGKDVPAFAHPIRRGAPPTSPAPARLGTARQRRRSGASRTGKPGPKNRVKDEAPPLARRRVGSGLSGFVSLSFLACGCGVSFRSLAPAVPFPVRVLFGRSVPGGASFRSRCVSFSRRGACRCVGAARRRVSAEHQRCEAVLMRTLGGAAAHSAKRCRRGAVSVFSFIITLIIRGSIHPAWLPQGNGPVQPGVGCPRQGPPR